MLKSQQQDSNLIQKKRWIEGDEVAAMWKSPEPPAIRHPIKKSLDLKQRDIAALKLMTDLSKNPRSEQKNEHFKEIGAKDPISDQTERESRAKNCHNP